MKTLVTLTVALVMLTGCATNQGVNTAIKVACQADVNAPAAVQAGGQIASTIDPAIAPEVAMASAIDLLVHPLVTSACGQAGVASVTTTAVPTPSATQ